MSAQSSCAHFEQTLAPHSRVWHYCDSDITTVYDALMSCEVSALARALLSFQASACKTGERHHQVERLLGARVRALKRLVYELGPNCECAPGAVVLPWDVGHLSSLSGVPWPDALGRRIALPASLPSRERHRLLAGVLLAFACL